MKKNGALAVLHRATRTGDESLGCIEEARRQERHRQKWGRRGELGGRQERERGEGNIICYSAELRKQLAVRLSS